jgi:hypothetical protein
VAVGGADAHAHEARGARLVARLAHALAADAGAALATAARHSSGRQQPECLLVLTTRVDVRHRRAEQPLAGAAAPAGCALAHARDALALTRLARRRARGVASAAVCAAVEAGVAQALACGAVAGAVARAVARAPARATVGTLVALRALAPPRAADARTARERGEAIIGAAGGVAAVVTLVAVRALAHAMRAAVAMLRARRVARPAARALLGVAGGARPTREAGARATLAPTVARAALRGVWGWG